MNWCRRGRTGTDYTVQASTVVIASSLAAALSGITAQQFGYAGHFVLAFALGVIALAAVAILFPAATRLHRKAGAIADVDDVRLGESPVAHDTRAT